MRSAPPLATALLSVVATAAPAAPFDGSKPFICASFELFSCVAGTECQSETAQSINAPQFLFVDVAKKKIEGVRPSGEIRTSAIDTVRKHRRLDLVGADERFAWTLSVEPMGRMTLTAAGDVGGDQTVLVIYGACTPREISAPPEAGR